MKRIYVASPLRGDILRNLDYARECLLDSLRRGTEAPFAPHLLYPQVLDDAQPQDRAQGMAAALAWLHQSDALALYVDLGVSEGMASEAREAMRRMPVWVRSIRTPAAVDLGEICTEEDLGRLLSIQADARETATELTRRDLQSLRRRS